MSDKTPFTYTYDDNGNITSVVQDGKKTAYTYDTLGQLTQLDDQQENATWVYTYDQGGNILSKKKYAYGVTTGEPTESKTFTYGNAKWKDQLTAVDGVAITYDAIGNPLNDGTWTYTWHNGRQLASMSKSGTTASFKYNENGLRVQKTVNGVVTDYTLHGKNIVHMKQDSNNLHFFYDAQSRPAVVVYNGTAYSYVKNLQGDIVAILNSAGTAVVHYTYDTWGRPISKTGTLASTIGTLNPFRYRGYVYDEEAEVYYLRTRYYNAGVGRFINADNHVVRNLFSYADGSPVCNEDKSGTESVGIPQLGSIDFAALGSSILAGISGLGSSFAKKIPWIAALLYILTPEKTADDEAVWDAIRDRPEYGNLEAELKRAKEAGLSDDKQPRKPTNIHHIVPKGMSAAQPARTILEEVGIDVRTSPENLVEVSTQMHQHMHTSAYTTGVNAIIEFAYDMSEDPAKQRVNVSLALSLISNLIRIVDQGQ